MDTACDPLDIKLREVLKEVRLDAAAAAAVDRAVAAVIDAIRSVPMQDLDPESASGFIRDLNLDQSKLGFTFRPPELVTIAGSLPLGAVVRPDLNADLLVRMPKQCFHEKDYLNHRYHGKRCLYLCAIEKSLRSLTFIHNIKWSTFQNEARKPVLLVYPVLDVPDLSEFYIRVIPTASGLFNISKLKLIKNNVRAFKEGDVNQATPVYNSGILEDMSMEDNTQFIIKAFKEWKNLQEALILLKVWARQRTTIHMHDCLNGYLISVIMAFLSSKSSSPLINKSMTVWQIFRVTLKFMSIANNWSKGLFFKPFSKKDKVECLKMFPVVVCYESRCFNLAFRMTKPALIELQDEAACALNCLDKCRDDGFEEIFMTKVDFAAKFDSCMRINLKGNAKVFAAGFCLDNECWRVAEKDVHVLLQQGLTDRATRLRAIWRNTPPQWDIHDGFSQFSSEPLHVGIIVSSEEKSFKLVDVGPNPEQRKEALSFRNFWGEKAELRRFKDGTIAESTVWDCEPSERHTIIKRIVEHVLTRHLSLKKEDVVHIVDQLDFCLQVGGKDPISFSGALFGAFDFLAKQLRNLKDIPLTISTVQPLDAAFRHAAVFPPEPHPLAFEKGYFGKPLRFAATCIPSLDVMIQLEGSGNWPMDHVAVEKTKSAFLLKIGESLQEKSGALCTATEDEVSVLVAGYSFSLKIFHEKGINLKSQAGNGTLRSAQKFDKELFLHSQHSSMINGLHGCYPMYEPVVRIAKRWMSAHMFSSFVAEEAVELIVAYLFLKPFPFSPPCSRIVGFLRFLRLLSSFDWMFTPLVVDINNDLSPTDVEEINEIFLSSRKPDEENFQDMQPAMFIATSYDKTSEAWTRHSPCKSVLKRMSAYAQSSAELLTKLIVHGQSGTFTWECLFRTPLNHYDAVVLLHRNKLPRPQHLLFPAEPPKGTLAARGKPSKYFQPYMPLMGTVKDFQDARNKVMVNFDPTRYYIRDLKCTFPEMFDVWHDSLGGEAIGLTWGKSYIKKRCREECDASQELLDILKEVGEVGKGFVKGVYLLKAPKLRKKS